MIVGTWIDGRPLYRVVKNIERASLGNNEWRNVVTLPELISFTAVNIRPIDFETSSQLFPSTGTFQFNPTTGLINCICPYSVNVNCLVIDYVKN